MFDAEIPESREPFSEFQIGLTLYFECDREIVVSTHLEHIYFFFFFIFAPSHSCILFDSRVRKKMYT